MLSKNKIKYIRSLELKKKRKEEQVFVAEGHKLVGDLLGHFPCKLLIATSNWLKMNHSATANEIIEVRISSFSLIPGGRMRSERKITIRSRRDVW